jgi:hypothetical protein
MLDSFTRYFQSLPFVIQVTILSPLAAFFLLQALKRHEDQTVTAFFLALASLALSWLAFAKAYWAIR